MERAIPTLPVDDLAIAKAYYVDGLEFSVAFESTKDGATGLLGIERGGMALTLDCPMAGHGRKACVSRQVESADRYYDEWRLRVVIEQAPMNAGWGARTREVRGSTPQWPIGKCKARNVFWRRGPCILPPLGRSLPAAVSSEV